MPAALSGRRAAAIAAAVVLWIGGASCASRRPASREAPAPPRDAAAPHVEESTLPSIALARYADGAWMFMADRTADHPRVAFPDDPIEEEAYAPVASGAGIPVFVRERRRRIAILADQPLTASLVSEDGGRIVYRVDQAPGGRFVVWAKTLTGREDAEGEAGREGRDPEELQAELTIYGSGVPIVRSERGTLRPAR